MVSAALAVLTMVAPGIAVFLYSTLGGAPGDTIISSSPGHAAMSARMRIGWCGSTDANRPIPTSD